MPKSISRKAKVEAAIKEIRELYELGCKSLQSPTKPNMSQTQRIEKEATKLGINPDTLRKARQFADAEKGYSRQELRMLCRQITDIQTNQESTHVFRKCHVIRILTIHPKKERSALQAEALQKGWSVRELNDEITIRYGARKDGGRPSRKAKDADDYLCKLEKMCESWRRWQQQTEDALQKILEKIPRTLRKKINENSKCLLDLQKAINKELKKQQGERQQRSALKNDNDTVDRRARR